MDLERISVAIERELLARFDGLQQHGKTFNRSEAVRDLIRRRLVEEEVDASGEAVASLTLIYDHEKRELADRLLETGHHHHGQILSTMHVHLDEHYCLEVMALRGKPAELRHLASHLLGLKGVKHGQLVMSSTQAFEEKP